MRQRRIVGWVDEGREWERMEKDSNSCSFCVTLPSPLPAGCCALWLHGRREPRPRVHSECRRIHRDAARVSGRAAALSSPLVLPASPISPPSLPPHHLLSSLFTSHSRTLPLHRRYQADPIKVAARLAGLELGPDGGGLEPLSPPTNGGGDVETGGARSSVPRQGGNGLQREIQARRNAPPPCPAVLPRRSFVAIPPHTIGPT